MKLLKTIYEKDIGLEDEKIDVEYKERVAARAVLFNDENKIALLFVAKHNYHKLPGGGADEEETLEQTLEREIMEEVGTEIKIKEEVGKIIEYRDKFELVQTSFCYIAKTVGKLKETTFTEKEKSQGFQLLWMDLDEAIKILQNDKPTNYADKFIQIRDLTFLLEAKKLCNL